MADGDLEEDEVWSTILKSSSSEDSRKKLMMMKRRRRSFNNNNNINNSCSSRPVPVERTSSSTIVDMVKYSSAPMTIPDHWSKIYTKPSSKRLDLEEEDDEEEEMMVLPPHEFLARKLAKTKISSFSMCEGVGRTLKGRDLCKLRNSILIQTGFLEQ